MVTMHQDLAYWGLGEIDGIVTAWLALSPATRQSGCMGFVKASHQSPIIPREDSFDDYNLLSRGQEIKVYVAEKDNTCGALDTGEFSLHHGLVIHGSGPNTTDNRRTGVVSRYISPHVKKPMKPVIMAFRCAGTVTLTISNSAPHQRACFIRTIC